MRHPPFSLCFVSIAHAAHVAPPRIWGCMVTIFFRGQRRQTLERERPGAIYHPIFPFC